MGVCVGVCVCVCMRLFFCPQTEKKYPKEPALLKSGPFVGSKTRACVLALRRRLLHFLSGAEDAARELWRLAYEEPESVASIVAAGAVAPLVKVLESGAAGGREAAPNPARVNVFEKRERRMTQNRTTVSSVFSLSSASLARFEEISTYILFLSLSRVRLFPFRPRRRVR